MRAAVVAAARGRDRARSSVVIIVVVVVLFPAGPSFHPLYNGPKARIASANYPHSNGRRVPLSLMLTDTHSLTLAPFHFPESQMQRKLIRLILMLLL